MASVVSQLVEEVTAHEQSDSLEDAREICADGIYFPNNLRTLYTEYNYTSTSPGASVSFSSINPLNAELNPICHLLALLGAHHILHVSMIRVKSHLPSAGIISSPYSPR